MSLVFLILKLYMLWVGKKYHVFTPPTLANGKTDSFRIKTGVGSSFLNFRE